MKIFRLITALLALVCCTPLENNGSQVSVNVRFACMDETKSSLVRDTETITDINLFVFRNGMLEFGGYTADPSSGMNLRFTYGAEYEMYAVANVGRIDFQGYDEASLKYFSFDYFSNSVPMAVKKTVTVGNQAEITLPLDRLISKISFNFETDNVTDGLKINSVRVMQAAGDITPFMDGGSKASYTRSGDYASASDIMSLNEGGTVTFYVGENCMGNLLPANVDPWAKVPDNLPEEIRDRCTYLEVSASFDTDLNIQSGDVVYRFYLGNNKTSDFSLLRNREYKITLVASGNGLNHGLNWKITADTIFEQGHGRIAVTGGNRTSLDNTYVGEKYLIEIIPDTPLLSYFAGDLTYCTIACEKAGRKSSAVKFSPVMISRGRFYSTMTCLEASSGLSLGLYDMWGRLVQTCVQNMTISSPRLVVGSDSIFDVYVNDEARSESLILTDSDGNNLCGSWYDNSVIDVCPEVVVSQSRYTGAGSSVSCEVEVDAAGSSRYGTLKISSTYLPGDDLSVGYSIVDALSSIGVINLKINERDKRFTQVTKPLRLKAQDVTVGHDNFKSTVMNSGKQIGVSPREITILNPSNLPIQLKAYSYAWYGVPHVSGLAPKTQRSYTMGTYSVVRYNAACFNTQEFAYTDVNTREVNFENTTISAGRYRIPSDDLLISDINAYILLGRSNRSDPTATKPDSYGPVMWSVFDVSFQGSTALKKIDNLNTDCLKASSGDSSIWTWGGVVLYSKDTYITRSEGGPSDCCIYSPTNVEDNLIGGTVATLWGGTDKNTNGTTKNITARLDGGKRSRLDITWKQACAVVLHPSGTAYSASYKWMSPLSYNSGGSKFSPGSSYTSSNCTYSSTLSASNSVELTPGAQYYTAFAVQSFIDSKIFSRYEKDYGGKLLATNSYNHQYHPVNFSMSGDIHTLDADSVYLISFASDFYASSAGGVLYSYKNSGYGGSSYNSDYSTTWNFTNLLLDKSVNGELVTSSNAYHLTR